MDKRYNKFNKKEQRVRVEKKEGDTKMQRKRCPHCSSTMRCRGPYDGVGTIYWKCRNSKCGRTIKVKRGPIKEVIPLVYVDRKRWLYGQYK